jgi:ribonuclease-3
MSSNNLDALMAVIGHRFEDETLLLQALTHTSVAHGRRPPKKAKPDASYRDRQLSNERLEFLGDRVLGLIVSDLLFREYPNEPEGALAKRHAQLVRREALAEVARHIGLGPYIEADVGEGTTAAESESMLGNACEAVIGALYLDGGIEAARKFVEPRWLSFARAERQPPQDPKTELQEWAQGRGLPIPRYRETGREGPPHAPHFRVEVSVEGESPEQGEGRSKRAAERAAAEALLNRLKEAS